MDELDRDVNAAEAADRSNPTTPAPDLTPTGRVILGMLALGKTTGYDIKQFVDKSTRHFWAASYGQIYPELRRMQDAGLVSAQDDPAGGRARVRWSITDPGRRALQAWLTAADDDGGTFEMRDEGMLRLFFLGAIPKDERPGVLERISARHRETARRLEEIRPFAASAPNQYPSKVLETGIAYHAWMADRFAEILQEETNG
jgi:DNA-binding PadR family transcriptional regulator